MPPLSADLIATLSSLFQNLSLLLSLALIYTVARPRLQRVSRQRSAIVTGIIFGVFAIAATFAPVLLDSGARFDGRSIPIAISGAFGGPVSAVVSVVVFLFFRVWAGSSGLLSPSTPIVPISTGLVAFVSIWFYIRAGNREQNYTPRQLALLGLYIALQSLIVNIILTPAATGATLTGIAIPLLIGYPLATALIGTLLVNEARRTKLSQDLSESEQRFRQMAESINQVFWLCDADTMKLIYLSPAFDKIWGVSRQAFIGTIGIPGVHPDDWERIASQGQTLHAGPLEIEYRAVHPDGGEHWISARAYPVIDADGHVRRIAGTAEDITARKQAEIALRASQHFVEHITGAVPDLLYVYDLRLDDRVFENRSLGEYLGYTPEQVAALKPQLMARLLHPDDSAALSGQEYRERQKRLADGEIIETTYRLKHASGDWRWLYSRDVPFQRADDGSVTQLIGIARDVTERKATEAALRQSQNFTERITNTVRDRIYVYDLVEKRSVYSNRGLDSILGYTPEQLAAFGSPVTALMHPEDQLSQAQYAERLAQLADGETLEYEYRMRHASGEWRWLFGHDTPFERGADGRVRQVLGLTRDITERKHNEERLRLYAEALERNNEELQMFAYTASHDLQEPLRKIQAFGDRLQLINGALLTDQGKDYLQRMMNASNRMQALIQDLLTYSRVTRLNQPFSLVEMNAVATAVCSDLEIAIAQADARIDIGPLHRVEADPTHMRQLLQNLIGNALKFRAPDRPLIVRVSARLIDQQGDGAEADTPLYELTVADNGIGFEEKYAERIFGIFQRLHGRNQYEGTGIGLAICRKIAERHHGTIHGVGDPGQGAAFVVTIPVRQPIEEEVTP